MDCSSDDDEGIILEDVEIPTDNEIYADCISGAVLLWSFAVKMKKKDRER